MRPILARCFAWQRCVGEVLRHLAAPPGLKADIPLCAGSSPGCDLELQIKTFEQQPIDQTPAGGCYQDASASCFNFPVLRQVAVPSEEAQTVVASLSDVPNWSEENAAQVIGLKWQFTGTHVDPDAGCPIDVTITDIKFLP